jgi:hypothetical protein
MTYTANAGGMEFADGVNLHLKFEALAHVRYSNFVPQWEMALPRFGGARM